MERLSDDKFEKAVNPVREPLFFRILENYANVC